MKRVLMPLLLIACLAWTPTIMAATSIGTVSLDKVYNGYWKTDVENKKLKDKQEEALGKIKKLNEALQKEGDVLQRMIKALNDPNL